MLRGRSYAEKLESFRASLHPRTPRPRKPAKPRTPPDAAKIESRRRSRAERDREREAERLDRFLADRESDRKWDRVFRRHAAAADERSPVGSSWVGFEDAIRLYGPPNSPRKMWTY
jgi:hypothetical protein